jgi:hypothetical protein
MKLIGSACLFGKIKDCMFISQDYSFPVLIDKKDYDDYNYLFIGELYFDDMHRPLFKVNVANATNLLGDYYKSLVYIEMTLRPDLLKGVVFDACLKDNIIVPVQIDCEIPDDSKPHLYKCELDIIEGAWTIIVKGSDVVQVQTFN